MSKSVSPWEYKHPDYLWASTVEDRRSLPTFALVLKSGRDVRFPPPLNFPSLPTGFESPMNALFLLMDGFPVGKKPSLEELRRYVKPAVEVYGPEGLAEMVVPRPSFRRCHACGAAVQTPDDVFVLDNFALICNACGAELEPPVELDDPDDPPDGWEE